MGPRIYPSQQDTNLTAKGSLLLNEDSEIAIVDVYVNNILVAKEYSNVDGLYVVTLNIGDVVRIESAGNFNVIPKRFDYTTDYENGDNGIKVTNFAIEVGLSAYTFTATTLSNGYNFEYVIDTSPFFINLEYEYSGITNPDNLYTIATTSQRVTIDNQQFNIPNFTYTSDTGFTYSLGQVFITGGTSSQSFDTRTILDPISGGDCVKWQFGVLTVLQNGVGLGTVGISPVTPVTCNASRTFNLGLGPYNLIQNATYTVRRRDTSQNIAPTPTPTPTVGPTPTPTPTPNPEEGQYMLAVRDNNLVYRTSNYGSSWSQVTGFTSGTTFVSSAISKTGQYQVISIYNNNVFMSDNYGVSFTGRTGSDRFISVAISTTGQYVSAITDNIGGGRKIRYSTNYGVTFGSTGIGQDATDVAVDDAGFSYISYRTGIQRLNPSTGIFNDVYTATTIGFGVQWDGVAVSGDATYLAAARNSTVAYRLSSGGPFFTGNSLNVEITILRNSRNGVFLKTFANGPSILYNSYSTNSGVSWSVDEFGFPALSHTGLYQAYALGDDIRLSTNYGSTYSTVYSLAGANWKNMSMNQ
jgi:hypothetical protein